MYCSSPTASGGFEMTAEQRENNDEALHCWDFVECSESIRAQCPVFRDKSYRCWEYRGTRCSEIVGFAYDCEDCRYYRSRAVIEALKAGKSDASDTE